MLRFLTSGESHGPCLTVIVEGVPAGLRLSEDDLAVDLARRQRGYGRGDRMRIEQDRAEILSGLADGLTTGAPIALRIDNRDWPNWKGRQMPILSVPRPGHADWAGAVKYGHSDLRIVLERASARETAARVAAGGIARKLLAEFGMSVLSQVVQIGSVRSVPAADADFETLARIENSPFRCAEPIAEEAMRLLVEGAQSKGDTLGGVFMVSVSGVVPGLGSYVHWDRRIDGQLAQALMSIQAIKGVEIGEGFCLSDLPGTAAHDGFGLDDGVVIRTSNRAGGIEGGVTNGQPVLLRAAMKPISSTLAPQQSVDLATGACSGTEYQRSDVCAVPAAAVVGEAMVALVMAGALLEKFGGDTIRQVKSSLEMYLGSSRYWLGTRE